MVLLLLMVCQVMSALTLTQVLVASDEATSLGSYSCSLRSAGPISRQAPALYSTPAQSCKSWAKRRSKRRSAAQSSASQRGRPSRRSSSAAECGSVRWPGPTWAASSSASAAQRWARQRGVQEWERVRGLVFGK